MQNPFVLKPNEYIRDLNIAKGYIVQNAAYLNKMTGKPMDVCMDFVKRSVSSKGKLPIKDPQVVALKQVSPGNREKVEETFLGYVQEVVATNRILSPSLTCYERPEVIKSTSADFVEGGIAGRKKAKNEMFQARIAGNPVLEYIKDCEQNAKKIGINSISGMHGFSGNILYVRSGHSSLTSMCRTATGYGNATNEKFLTGSRHYWNADIAMANILAIITNTDYAQLEACLQQYNIVIPTVEQTMECVVRSTELYFRNPTELARIGQLVEKLNDLERAAFVYIGDMYHLAKYNDALVREFMRRFVEPDLDAIEIGDPDEALAPGIKDTDISYFVNLLSANEIQGIDREKLKERNPEGYRKLAKTYVAVAKTLEDYTPLIKALWVPKTLPPTVANIKSIVRRTVLASDTDSTIFTTQDWVKWYTGSYKRTTVGDGVWYTMTYLATQCIIHVLAQFSANMGVSPKDLHRLSMKNEYAFPVFALTARAKHYFAFRSAREGNVYVKPDMEIKGVALRSSIVPIDVIARAKDLMEEILETINQGKQFKVSYLYDIIYGLEKDIENSIAKGESRFLKTGQIKETYKNMATSAYQQYLLWEEVFAPKYGITPPPPYSVIKAPLEIRNKTDMKNWLDGMEDRDLAKRLEIWCKRAGRDKITTLLLPTSLMSEKGMPKEVLQGMNIRKLTYETLESFYMLLEVVGMYHVHSSQVRLVSDIYTPAAS